MTSNNLLNYHKPRKVPLGSSRGEDSDEAREGEDWARGRRMAVAGAETATLHVTQPRDTEPRLLSRVAARHQRAAGRGHQHQGGDRPPQSPRHQGPRHGPQARPQVRPHPGEDRLESTGHREVS